MDNRIQMLHRQYFQQVDVEKLSFPADSVLLEPVIQTQIFDHMFKSHSMFLYRGESLLPTLSYQKRFLRSS